LPEKTKYDFFMEEINSLEKQVYALVQKGEALIEENSALNKKINQLEMENEVLLLKIEEIESLNPGADLNNFSSEDRETLKKKIEDFISKIDNHIGS